MQIIFFFCFFCLFQFTNTLVVLLTCTVNCRKSYFAKKKKEIRARARKIAIEELKQERERKRQLSRKCSGQHRQKKQKVCQKPTESALQPVLENKSVETYQTTFRVFEDRTKALIHQKCQNCMEVRLTMQTYRNNICAKCTRDKSKYSIGNNMLPIWKDVNETIMHNIPDELAELTTAEQLLIQRASPYVPVYHIKNGILGIKGHVCSFEQDIQSFCDELPRLPPSVRILHVQKHAISSTNPPRMFRVRRQKVLDALNWLKQHNTEYQDIRIKTENLDWMGTSSEQTFPNIEKITTTSSKDDDEEMDIGPAPLVNVQPHLKQNEELDDFGMMSENSSHQPSEESKTVSSKVKDAVKNSRLTSMKNIAWPDVSEVAISEYSSYKIFINAFPWLFPGGVGDFNDQRNIPVNPDEWIQHLLFYYDGRFSKASIFRRKGFFSAAGNLTAIQIFRSYAG